MLVTMQKYLLLASLILAPAISAQEFTLYLTRHAEKQPEQKNPNLTSCGSLRAQHLAEMLSLAKIKHVYSTPYNRTLETAAPTAKALGLGIKQYSPKVLEQFAITLLKEKENALVVGHSNTTPALASFLTGEEIEMIDEKEYQLLFQITIDGDDRDITVLKQPLECRK
mgnify:CR=1 FL=1